MSKLIRRETILEQIELVSPNAVPEPTLKLRVTSAMGEPITEADFDDDLIWLQSRGLIKPMPARLGDEDEEGNPIIRWVLTEAGQAELLRR